MIVNGQETKRAAAFFDVDGTLVEKPSLERRFAWQLWWKGALPKRNLLFWCAETLRQLPNGWQRATQSNKLYLKNVAVNPLEVKELAVRFFPSAVGRVAWHAMHGHRIVLVTGTLNILAERVADALRRELIYLGCAAEISVCATKLETEKGKWSGRVAGELMFGEEKVAAMKKFAAETGTDLANCAAYGDSTSDQYMLRAAGYRVAVNPSRELRRIAVREGWSIVDWRETRRETLREGYEWAQRERA